MQTFTGYKEQPRLRKALGASQFFTVAFGAIVGVSWIVLLGEWLNLAGPLGAVFAFTCGAVVSISVGLCYAEIAALIPVSGGEAAYAYECFGLRSAYFIGWILALIDIAVVSYMCIAVTWILDFLVPGFQGPDLYSCRGGSVHLMGLLVSLGGVWSLTYLNYRGVRSATTFQDTLTYGKLAISVVFIMAGVFGGRMANLRPLFRSTGSGTALRGILAVFVTSLWFYGGFNNVPQVMEERAGETSFQSIGRVIVLSIGVAAAFYCAIILSTAMATPWQNLVSKDLPAATAFREAFHSEALARAVLLAGLFGAFTGANSYFVAGSRLFFALGRAGIIGPKFGRIHPLLGSPVAAVMFVGLVASVGVFFGRGGILPIVNIGSTCYALAYIVTCLGVIRLRRSQPERYRPYQIPGGKYTASLAALFSFLMLLLSIYQPYADAKGSFPLEWGILLVWALLGVLFWRLARKVRTAISEVERRRLILGQDSNGSRTSSRRDDS
jgi:basic amino acid/polyamine antiporter, APA family